MKNQGLKIHLWGVIWVPSSRLILSTCQKKIDNIPVQYEDVRGLVNKRDKINECNFGKFVIVPFDRDDFYFYSLS